MACDCFCEHMEKLRQCLKGGYILLCEEEESRDERFWKTFSYFVESDCMICVYRDHRYRRLWKTLRDFFKVRINIIRM